MLRIIFVIDHMSTWVGKAFAWAILVLTAVVSYEVFMRYVLRAPTEWAYDTTYILYGTLFMMAGAYALSRNGHVRADVVSRYFKPRFQAGLDIALYLMFFYPGIIALVWAGTEFASMSWAMNERSSYSPGGPPLYHFKTVIPVAAALLALQGVAELLRCILCLRDGHWPPRLGDVQEMIPIQKRDEVEELSR
jgi:TRAP-type mannitol/chloroaromatic compound transport system permease small subunit